MKKITLLLSLFLISVSSSKDVNQGDKSAEPLNIIWINLDDLGKDIACYGNPDVKTPNIDKFASEGVILKCLCKCTNLFCKSFITNYRCLS
jgi:hypothetical protein